MYSQIIQFPIFIFADRKRVPLYKYPFCEISMFCVVYRDRQSEHLADELRYKKMFQFYPKK